MTNNGGVMSNGKGDRARPLSVPADTFADRWAATFGGKFDESALESGLQAMMDAPHYRPNGVAPWPGWDEATPEQRETFVRNLRQYPHIGGP